MLSFVTIFDKYYMSRGIVLYESLSTCCCDSFTLYVLAMDGTVAEYLLGLGYDRLRVIPLQDMKETYPVLARLEKERTRGEFSWTLSSFSVQYAIRKFNLDSCIYVDSDVCFYNDPQILLDGLGDRSVLITEHNYSPEYDQSFFYGKYCVQFMYFKNDAGGNKVLEWWRSRCEEWCYARMEDGKFGDQKYLDDWESRFEGIVYNCRDIGCGVAPWNIQKYEITKEYSRVYITDLISRIKRPLVFFHYHALTENENGKWYQPHYRLDQKVIDTLYKPYIGQLYDVEKKYPKGLVEKRGKKVSFSLHERLSHFYSYIKKYQEISPFRITLIG